MLDATVAHFYAWLRTRDMPQLDRELWLLGLGAKAHGVPARRTARSRAAFNRDFYRVYANLPARELRDQAADALPDFIQPRIQHEAVRRIRAAPRRGDRVVLVTGALDFLVDSLRHLADELIAARLVERAGRFTGELAEPPLTADGRASMAARLAAEHGVALADCHAYGDSLSDLPMLELVGPPARRQPRLPPRPRGAPARTGRSCTGRPSREHAPRRPPPWWADARARVQPVGASARRRPVLPEVGERAAAAQDLDPPRLPGPDWLPVRPRLSGICGSDQALVYGSASLYLASLTSSPFVPGHEVVGEVA